MSDVKFQKDGSEKLYKMLFENKGSQEKRRALLADEVGLGKTITAGRLIALYANEHPNETIRIGYICRNLALTKENTVKLRKSIEQYLTDKSRKIVTSDNQKDDTDGRFSLKMFNLAIGHSDTDDSNIYIYGLTPSTSIKLNAKSGGRIEERALACHLTPYESDCSNLDEIELDSIDELYKTQFIGTSKEKNINLSGRRLMIN